MIADGLFIVKKIKNGLTMQNKKYPQNVPMSTLLSILLISSSLILILHMTIKMLLVEDIEDKMLLAHHFALQ